MDHFKNACEGVDAAVFSGDTLSDADKRVVLKDYLFRWQYALNQFVLQDRIDTVVAEARRKALYDAADDFEAGASPDDIRSNAERIERG